MDTIPSKIVICAALFVITLVSGFVLSNLGKPLNTFVFTIHKLVAIGTVILLAVSIYQVVKTVDLQALYLAVWAVAGLSFLALIVSGALLSLVDGNLLSLEGPALTAILRVHQAAPLLALVFSTVSVYLLNGSQA